MLSMLCMVCSWFGIGIKSLCWVGLWKYLLYCFLILDRLVCSLCMMLFNVWWLEMWWYRFFI